jgi:hypothetical protein
MMTKKRWSNRALTSLLSLWGFMIMAGTGVVLYIVPQGRIAYWVEWTFLGLNKEQWGAIHILSMFLFLGAIGFHIYFNWKPLIGYLKSRATQRFGARRELIASLLVAVVFVASGILPVKPLGYLLDLEELIKESWVASPADEPPFGHAELLRLDIFCKKTHIPVAPALSALEAAGFSGVTPDRTLVDLARENDTSPRDIYLAIQHLEAPPEIAPPPANTGMTLEYVEETFGGTGVGRKTIAEVASQLGLDPEEPMERLTRKGLAFDADQSIKQIADRNDLAAPIEVLKAMLVD